MLARISGGCFVDQMYPDIGAAIEDVVDSLEEK